jgi:hypothetical protein
MNPRQALSQLIRLATNTLAESVKNPNGPQVLEVTLHSSFGERIINVKASLEPIPGEKQIKPEIALADLVKNNAYLQTRDHPSGHPVSGFTGTRGGWKLSIHGRGGYLGPNGYGGQCLHDEKPSECTAPTATNQPTG